MKAKSGRLVVVAHPDDETIFFGGLVQAKRDRPWLLICLTDGNADGRGAERKQELAAAAKLVGFSSFEHWSYPDLFPNRLPVDEIAARLRQLPAPYEVYSHGPIGEYGHPHHQDTCLAVHRAFSPRMKVISPAWNCRVDFSVKLTPAQYAKKTRAFIDFYRKETARFLNILPNSGIEAFRRFESREVEAIVGFFRKERALEEKALKDYRWLAPVLPDLRKQFETRLF
jgi:GlcNAc-PI de-N-acetylase